MRKIEYSNLFLCLFLYFSGLCFVYGQSGEVKEVKKTTSIIRWNEFLEKNFDEGVSVEDIHKKMKGKWRDSGQTASSGKGDYLLVFLIDDVYQIEFQLSVDNKLMFAPLIKHKRVWLRFPDGHIEFKVE